MKQKIILLSLIFSVWFSSNCITAQETKLSEKERRKIEKEEKKKQKEAEELANYYEAKSMVDTKRFVFTASEAYAGGVIGLDQKTNFFLVIENDATLQTAVPVLEGYPNPNGLGGITVEGKVESYEVKIKGENKPIIVQIIFKPNSGQGRGVHTFVLFVFGDGYAELQFPGTVTRLKGTIQKPEDSYIYKGTTM